MEGFGENLFFYYFKQCNNILLHEQLRNYFALFDLPFINFFYCVKLKRKKCKKKNFPGSGNATNIIMLSIVFYLSLLSLLYFGNVCQAGTLVVTADGSLGCVDLERLKMYTLCPTPKPSLNPVTMHWTSNQMWILDQQNKLYFRNGLDLAHCGDKWKNTFQLFVSITTNVNEAVYAVDQNGQIYKCDEQCQKEPSQASKWTKMVSPPKKLVTVESQILHIKSKTEGSLVTPFFFFFFGKVVQLTSSKKTLFGRDEVGHVWKFLPNSQEWLKLPFEESFQWISASEDDNELYLIKADSGLIMKWEEGKLEMLDESTNDFVQIACDFWEDGAIYAINYYQQLFYFDRTHNTWIFVDENVRSINVAQAACQLLKKDL
ncbi:hypothetical protein RFI_17934 [Reticulomyxa filosa]|uniref:Uncharacterized protein n=1 Tax=Reticulomyxa filosa TaxID=46433 RepID=X6N0M9_RETFI|nr:hypothetical protein RFI_17934 [Reticulomyxa filosa]|eukprot:ETO19299.1 hypothetical protein RFI_17934 [Reticulomyxa filosa]